MIGMGEVTTGRFDFVSYGAAAFPQSPGRRGRHPSGVYPSRGWKLAL